MADTTTCPPRLAQQMPSMPWSVGGFPMPMARWYHLSPPAFFRNRLVAYVAVTELGVYECDSDGEHVDFTARLDSFATGAADAGTLAHLDGGYEVQQ